MKKQRWDNNWQEKEMFVEIDADVFDSLKKSQQKELKQYDYHITHIEDIEDIDSPPKAFTFLLPNEVAKKYLPYKND